MSWSSHQERFYPETRFGGFTRIDGTIEFFTRVNALITPESVVLDVGCGRGAYGEDPVALRRNLRIFRGRVRRVIGIDADPRAAANPYLDEFHHLDGDRWPVADDSVDVCIAVDVLEHVANPDAFFAECRRVLRDGGYLCIRTTNSWGYPALVARLVPNRLHTRVLGRVEEKKKKHEDVFPTRYRCNSIPRIRSILKRHGMDGVVYGCDSEPGYLSFARLAYFLGVLHQRYAPRAIAPGLFTFARVSKPPRALGPGPR